jgi:hypothetical protein
MLRASDIIEVNDINNNGIAEVVITTQTCNGGCTDVQILEWDGITFHDLLNWQYPYLNPSVKYLDALKDLVITDVDDDGNSEIILEDGPPLGNLAAYLGGYPWRNKTFVFKWDMTQYSLIRFEFEPPYYRFEALHDGDQATLVGDFSKALSFYEQAIFDETLEWWSYERWKYVDSWHMSNYGGIPSPTPLSPDQDADTNLIAYARYRIVLLHSLQGSIGDAQAAYNTLHVEHGLGMNGYIFAQMATIFWDEFESSGDVAEACQEVNSFAVIHSEEIGLILPYYYQELVEKICPNY